MDRFQVLSLSGGGYFGLYTISILAELEKDLDVPIARCFDLIAGTSVGGIIALGLACETPASKIKKAFEEHGTEIFSDRPVPMSFLERMVDLSRFAFKPKYDGVSLRKTINDIVGDGKRIGDLGHRVVVPAVNVTKGSVQVFKTPHHPSFKRDLKLAVTDVAMATAAAPTYFPLAAIEDSLFADGGLFANAPDLIALHEADIFLNVDVANVHMLSIGTTTSRYALAHEDAKSVGGAMGWMTDQRLVNVFLSAQQQAVTFMAKHRLGDRYLRLDWDQSKSQERHLALDVATLPAQSTIRGLAEATVQQAMGQSHITNLLRHRASAATFFNKESS